MPLKAFASVTCTKPQAINHQKPVHCLAAASCRGPALLLGRLNGNLRAQNARSTLMPHQTAKARKLACRAALSAGDEVVVVGGTEPLGVMLLRKLNDGGKYKPQTMLKDPDDPRWIVLYEGAGVKGIDPTNAQEMDEKLEKANAVILAVESSMEPPAIRFIAEGTGEDSIKKFIYVSRIGIERRGSFAWRLKNLRGELDKYAAAEAEVFTNKMQSFELELGDKLDGDTSRVTLRDLIIHLLENDDVDNKIISLVNTEGKERPPFEKALASLVLA
eukprot:jgi/Mesvir1/21470/Mv03926-RA.1